MWSQCSAVGTTCHQQLLFRYICSTNASLYIIILWNCTYVHIIQTSAYLHHRCVPTAPVPIQNYTWVHMYTSFIYTYIIIIGASLSDPHINSNVQHKWDDNNTWQFTQATKGPEKHAVRLILFLPMICEYTQLRCMIMRYYDIISVPCSNDCSISWIQWGSQRIETKLKWY